MLGRRDRAVGAAPAHNSPIALRHRRLHPLDQTPRGSSRAHSHSCREGPNLSATGATGPVRNGLAASRSSTITDGIPSVTVISRCTGLPCCRRSRIDAPPMPSGIWNSPGLDRVGRTEQPRHRPVSRALPRDRALFLELAGDGRDRRALLDDDRVRTRLRARHPTTRHRLQSARQRRPRPGRSAGDSRVTPPS